MRRRALAVTIALVGVVLLSLVAETAPEGGDPPSNGRVASVSPPPVVPASPDSSQGTSQNLRISGVVTGLRGPIAGARVRMSEHASSRVIADGATGERGRFVLAATVDEPEELFLLRIDAPGHASARRVVRHREDVRIQLRAECVLIVAVRTTGGGVEAVGPATIVLDGDGVTRRREIPGLPGEVRIAGLSSWGYQLLVEAEGFAPRRVFPVAVPAGGERRIEVALDRGGAVRVRVRDAATGAAIRGASVVLDGRAHATEAADTIRIAVSPGIHTLLGSAPGYRRAGLTCALTEEDVRAETELALSLQPSSQIGGIVRDPAGSPVAGARVTLSPVETYVLTETDAGGRWTAELDSGALEAVEPVLQVERYGFRRVVEEVEWSGRQALREGSHVTVLHPASWCRGRVVDEEARPVPGARAVLRVGRSHLSGWTTAERTIVTDEEGRYGFPVSPGEEVDVRASSSWGFSRRSVSVTTEDTGSEASEVHLDDLVLVAGMAWQGTVRDRQGRPVAAARVRIADARAGPLGRADTAAVTGPAGEFAVVTRAFHSARIVVEAEGYVRGECRTASGAAPVILLDRAPFVTLVLLGPDGRPFVGEGRLTVGPVRRPFVTTDGRIALGHVELPAASVAVEARRPGAWLRAASGLVRPDGDVAEQEIVLRLKTELGQRLRIRGRNVLGLHVTLIDPVTAVIEHAVTDPRGEVLLPAALSEHARVEIHRGGALLGRWTWSTLTTSSDGAREVALEGDR